MRPEDSVASTYDVLAPRWTKWADAVAPPLREHYVNVLAERLPSTSRALEIGCGTGVPVAALLARHLDLYGIDISEEMVRIARTAVPTGHFDVGDISEMEFDQASFDGVVAFYSLAHLPREMQVTLFSRIFHWLRPDGLLVANLGTSDTAESVEEDWLGSGRMFWSSYDAEANLLHLERAGYTVEQASVIPQVEPSGNEVAFLWVVARKAG